MIKRFALLAVALPLLFLSGCVKDMDMVEFKTGDKAEGFWDPGKHELRVYLEDGDVLTGKYVKMNSPRFSIGANVGGFGSRGIWGVHPRVGFKGVGNIYALLESSKSSTAMEVIVDYKMISGSGHGEARTNDGRVYKVVF